MEKTINCEECGIEFTFEENPKYPRKYCLNCSAKKKKQYAERDDEKNVSPHTEGYGTTETTEFGAPVEKVPTTMTKLVPEKQAKEFHLSPEQVRTNALNCAIAVCEREREKAPVDLIELALKFEDYLWNGK